MPQNKNDTSQSGNVFLIILIGVVLFGALMFTVSKGVRQGSDTLPAQRAGLIATDILTFSQNVERGVQRVLRRGVSEVDIGFESSFVQGHNSANCLTSECQVFHKNGGGASARGTVSEWFEEGSHQSWRITAANNINNSPTNGADLLLILSRLRLEVCKQINNKLGHDETPVDDNSGLNEAAFNGSYNAVEGISGPILPKGAACINDAGGVGADGYTFIKVLIPR